MTGHTRLYRRGATYYHRAAIPVDIQDTYPKSEETFSLKTKDYQEALRLIRIAAVKVDRKFEAHRHQLFQVAQPQINELSDEQIKRIGEVYFVHLLDEDDEIRLSSFEEKTFEEHEEDIHALDHINRRDYARGDLGSFFMGEAEEVLTWGNVGISLAPESLSWKKVARELQAVLTS